MYQEQKDSSVHSFATTLTIGGNTEVLITKLTYNHKRDTYSIATKITTKMVGYSQEERDQLIKAQSDLTKSAISKAFDLMKESNAVGVNLFTDTEDDPNNVLGDGFGTGDGERVTEEDEKESGKRIRSISGRKATGS